MKSIIQPMLKEWGTDRRVIASVFLLTIMLLVPVLLPYLSLLLVALLGVLLGVGFLKYPEIGLCALVIGLFTLDSLASIEAIPQIATWLPELFLLALAARVAIEHSRKSFRGSVPYIDVWVGLILALSALSALMNIQSPIVYFLGLRASFKYIVMFYLLINSRIPLRWLLRAGVLFWMFVFVQPIMIVGQYVKSNYDVSLVDTYHGTLENTAVLAIMGGCAAALALGYYLEKRNKKYLVLMFPLLISLGMADSKAGFWFVALVLIAISVYSGLLSRDQVKRLRIILFLGVFSSILYVAISYASQNLSLDIMNLILNPKEALAYDAAYDINYRLTGTVGRGFDIRLALETIRRSYIARLMGYGLGSASESVFTEYSGSVYLALSRTIGRSVFWVQLARMIVELGYVGAVLYVGLYSGLFLMGHRVYSKANVPELKALSLSLLGFVVVIAAAHVYQTILDVPNFILWFTAATVVRGSIDEQNT